MVRIENFQISRLHVLLDLLNLLDICNKGIHQIFFHKNILSGNILTSRDLLTTDL